jgi:hypothetical protein
MFSIMALGAAITKLPCSNDQKNTEEDETIGNIEPIVKISDAKKLSMYEETDDTAEHK